MLAMMSREMSHPASWHLRARYAGDVRAGVLTSLAVLNATPTFCTFFEGVVMKRADSPYRAAALQSDGGITRLDEASLSHMSRACRFNNSSGVVIRLLEDLLCRHMGSGERRDAGVH